ncbi:MAG TPA: hypothetical protein PKD10_18360 [Paracoccaceae bacterium]|nr:hypothetical protein [Paracoccaceae bacterium]
MNPLIWLMRMSRWSRNPPPMWKVKLVAGVIVACVALVAAERFLGWPDWLTMQRLRAPR